MGFLKKVVNVLGFLHGNCEDRNGDMNVDQTGVMVGPNRRDFLSASASSAAAQGVRRGFSVSVPVVSDRPRVVPVLVPCDAGEGVVQGFKWYGQKLKVDEDGDVADEFLDEALPEEVPQVGNQKVYSTFKINHRTRPAALEKQIFVSNGNVHQGVEHRGRLQRA